MSKFKVLWIDDEKNKIQLEMDNLEKSLLKHGFQPEIKYLDSINYADIKPDNNLGADLKARVYDLIFIDFKLKGVLGSDIISEMRRKNNIYTDIVFYSSDGDDLKQKIKGSFDKGILEYIDDVHIAILDDGDYDEKIDKVIEKVIGSWYCPSAFRGIVLDKTCKFERIVSCKLNDCIKKLPIDKNKEFVNLALYENKKLSNGMLTKFNKIVCVDKLIEFISMSSHVFNWNFKYRLLGEFIKEKLVIGMDQKILDILNEVFTTRNSISHNEIEFRDACIFVKSKDGDIKYDEQKVKDVIDKINKIDNCFAT